MISTVTTTTVTTVTTGTITMLAGLAFFAVLTLLIVLIAKEVASAGQGPRWRGLNQGLNVAIVPLLIAFVVIAAVQICQVLR